MKKLFALSFLLASMPLQSVALTSDSTNEEIKKNTKLQIDDRVEAFISDLPNDNHGNKALPELLCRGISNPQKRVALLNIDGKIWGRVFDGSELIASGIATKSATESGTGKIKQSRIVYKAGRITNGGYNIRLVSKYTTFPDREGQGNVTVIADGKISNDTIDCFFFSE